MPNQPGLNSRSETITILSVSPFREDHEFLQGIFGHSSWTVLTAPDLTIARRLLHRGVSVVLCECDLRPDTWIAVLGEVQGLPVAPSLIVTSRLADDRLWAEALNLGAYDVLAKPFERSELLRSVRLAWEHWRRATTVAPPQVMTAAS